MTNLAFAAVCILVAIPLLFIAVHVLRWILILLAILIGLLGRLIGGP